MSQKGNYQQQIKPSQIEWDLSKFEHAWEFAGGDYDENEKPYRLNPMDDSEILKLVQEAYFIGMENAYNDIAADVVSKLSKIITIKKLILK